MDSLVTVIAPTALVLATLAIMASRTLALVRAEPQGRVELEVHLGLMQRFLAQKANVMAVCTVVILGGGAFGGTRWIPPLISYAAIAAAAGMVLKPQRVLFTSAGVQPHPASFRSWQDFDTAQLSGSRLVLHSATRLASVNVYIPTVQRSEVERLVRRHLRAPQASPAGRSTGTSRARRARPARAAAVQSHTGRHRG